MDGTDPCVDFHQWRAEAACSKKAPADSYAHGRPPNTTAHPPFLSHHLSHPAAARGEARTLVGYLFCTFTLAVWKSN